MMGDRRLGELEVELMLNGGGDVVVDLEVAFVLLIASERKI